MKKKTPTPKLSKHDAAVLCQLEAKKDECLELRNAIFDRAQKLIEAESALRMDNQDTRFDSLRTIQNALVRQAEGLGLASSILNERYVELYREIERIKKGKS